MSQKTTEINKALQLLEARKEALVQKSQTTMKPFGKIRGADTFTWHHVPPKALAQTLLNLPFPIVWITTVQDLVEVNEHLRKETPAFKSIVCHGQPTHEVDINEDLYPVTYVSDISEGLAEVAHLLNKNSVLLVTGMHDEEQRHREVLNQFKTIQ